MWHTPCERHRTTLRGLASRARDGPCRRHCAWRADRPEIRGSRQGFRLSSKIEKADMKEKTAFLLLMRHAKSDWHAAVASDFDRPLNPRGRRDAPRMGRWLRRQGIVPERVLASPAKRACQTAEAVRDALGLDPGRLWLHDKLYLADRRTLTRMLAETGRNPGPVLLVAHNPGLDDLVTWLAADPPPLSPSGKLMTTAAIAWFELPGGLDRLEAGCGRLLGLWRPAELPGMEEGQNQ